MKIYIVYNEDYHDQFTNLRAAKQAMKEHHAKRTIMKCWANGDWEDAGEIKLNGSNKTFLANTRQRKLSY